MPATTLPRWCQNRPKKMVRLIKLTPHGTKQDAQIRRRTLYCFERKKTKENIRLLHKISSLLQDLENGNIGNYQQTNKTIYDPYTKEHLQHDFIEENMKELLQYNHNHETSIQEKIAKIKNKLNENDENENRTYGLH